MILTLDPVRTLTIKEEGVVRGNDADLVVIHVRDHGLDLRMRTSMKRIWSLLRKTWESD
jgi:hypothetical protein